MPIATEAADIFADARAMHASAVERLAADDVRDAAEKAWCATKRATDGLLTALTGSFPETTRQTSNRLRRLAVGDPRVEDLVGVYDRHQAFLHGECFYVGLCEPLEALEGCIRATADFIAAAEALAAA